MSDYAVVVLSHMAASGARQWSAQHLSEVSGLGLPTVSKLLKALVKHGVLDSVRGSHGGYMLASAASGITMADVVEAVDGPIAITECSHGSNHCSMEVLCPTKTGWQKINLAVKEALATVSLAEMLPQPEPNWHMPEAKTAALAG